MLSSASSALYRNCTLHLAYQTHPPFAQILKGGWVWLCELCCDVSYAVIIAIVKSNHVMQIGITWFNWNVLIIINGLDNARLYDFYLGSYLVGILLIMLQK